MSQCVIHASPSGLRFLTPIFFASSHKGAPSGVLARVNKVRSTSRSCDARLMLASQWHITPSVHPNLPPPSETPIGAVSILTGRTMDEIKACRPAELLVSADLREQYELACDDGVGWDVGGLPSMDIESMSDAGAGRGNGDAGPSGIERTSAVPVGADGPARLRARGDRSQSRV